MGVIRLLDALRLEPFPHPARLALVGAGGKTTALFRLARDLVETPLPGGRREERGRRGVFTPTVLVTTTTHLGVDQARFADRHIIIHAPEQIDALEADLPGGVVLLTGEPDSQDRLVGLSPAHLERLRLLADRRRLPLLVEADGSRTLPLKAPAAHEPAIPGLAQTVVVVAGLSGLGKPLSAEWVHRPEIFASLSGLSLGEPVTAPALASVLLHPQGGLKNIPPGARRLCLLNQADTPELQSIAGSLAKNLLSAYHAILVASFIPPSLPSPELEATSSSSNSYLLTPDSLPLAPHPSPVYSVHEGIAAIILAAGESQRFGAPKPLLLWRGEPFIRHTIRTAQGAGLSPVIVVGWEHLPELRLACDGLDVELVHNPDWQAGQSTSLQAGLRHLPPEAGGAVFLLADQPQVPSELVRLLVETHAAGLPPIVAPLVDGRRGNPALFDRVTFPDLMALGGDVGGRALFSKYALTWVPWHDSSLLLDVDTPEDYQKLLAIE